MVGRLAGLLGRVLGVGVVRRAAGVVGLAGPLLGVAGSNGGAAPGRVAAASASSARASASVQSRPTKAGLSAALPGWSMVVMFDDARHRPVGCGAFASGVVRAAVPALPDRPGSSAAAASCRSVRVGERSSGRRRGGEHQGGGRCVIGGGGLARGAGGQVGRRGGRGERDAACGAGREGDGGDGLGDHDRRRDAHGGSPGEVVGERGGMHRRPESRPGGGLAPQLCCSGGRRRCGQKLGERGRTVATVEQSLGGGAGQPAESSSVHLVTRSAGPAIPVTATSVSGVRQGSTGLPRGCTEPAGPGA